MQRVPFENLDVFAGRPVDITVTSSFDKVVARGRGGWCFELNGLFAGLLESLGFTVKRLGAAVLLAGPNDRIDHLMIEVVLDQAYLVDVGFGSGAPIAPLPLQQRNVVRDRAGEFEVIASPAGSTLAEIVDGVPEARYRFKRVNHKQADFEASSTLQQTDRTLVWSKAPFASRLVDGNGTRLTLARDRLITHGTASRSEVPIAAAEWNEALMAHFGIVEAFTEHDLAQT